MKAGPDLPGLLTTLNITCLSTVPTLLNTIPVNELPTVRLIIVGGEACSRELANRWSANKLFFNTYGPTEATVVATVQLCQPKLRQERVPIGVPLSNYRVYVKSCTCWWYSLCNFQYRQQFENTCSYNVEC